MSIMRERTPACVNSVPVITSTYRKRKIAWQRSEREGRWQNINDERAVALAGQHAPACTPSNTMIILWPWYHFLNTCNLLPSNMKAPTVLHRGQHSRLQPISLSITLGQKTNPLGWELGRVQQNIAVATWYRSNEDEGFHDFECLILRVYLVSSIQYKLYLHNWHTIIKFIIT